jgi:guanylate kinase
MKKNGLLVVISAPSGGGKTTIIQRVLAEGHENYRYSISATTRERRGNERHGVDYFFLSLAEFEATRDRSEFAEWAEVHGCYYGTPKPPLDRWLEEGRIVFLDLDVDGGLQIKEQYGESALLIFINPPSYESLVERLKSRQTESQAQIDKRLERYPKEIEKSKYYDHRIVNENLDSTAREITRLLNQRVEEIKHR